MYFRLLLHFLYYQTRLSALNMISSILHMRIVCRGRIDLNYNFAFFQRFPRLVHLFLCWQTRASTVISQMPLRSILHARPNVALEIDLLLSEFEDLVRLLDWFFVWSSWCRQLNYEIFFRWSHNVKKIKEWSDNHVSWTRKCGQKQCEMMPIRIWEARWVSYYH